MKAQVVDANRRRLKNDPVFREKHKANTRKWVGKARARIGKKTSGGYRSEMEARVAPPVLAAGGEYEPLRLVYNTKPRGYCPDFVLPNGIAIEVKGWFPACDRSKMLAVKAQYPELDLRMVLASPRQFITSKRLVTQSQWCEQHGIGWAEGEVPASWFSEPENAASRAVLQQGKRVKKSAA